jgi:hypothetical protein
LYLTLALDLPHMSRSMAVAGGARLLQREINQTPPQHNRRQRVVALQSRGRRIKQLVEIAVDLLDAGIDTRAA